jgi:hypothetical protein
MITSSVFKSFCEKPGPMLSRRAGFVRQNYDGPDGGNVTASYFGFWIFDFAISTLAMRAPTTQWRPVHNR